MAYIIGEKCICCGTCEEECPGDAIKYEMERYVIKTDKCLNCGTCAMVCPVNAPRRQK